MVSENGLRFLQRDAKTLRMTLEKLIAKHGIAEILERLAEISEDCCDGTLADSLTILMNEVLERVETRV